MRHKYSIYQSTVMYYSTKQNICLEGRFWMTLRSFLLVEFDFPIVVFDLEQLEKHHFYNTQRKIMGHVSQTWKVAMTVTLRERTSDSKALTHSLGFLLI
jgi:hypothetical protein